MSSFTIWSYLSVGAILVLGAVLIGVLRGSSPDLETLNYFSREFLERAAEYERRGLVLYLIRQGLVLAFFTLSAFWAVNRFSSSMHVPVLKAAMYFFAFLLLLHIITLPLDFYRGFIVEHRYSMSTQTLGSWFGDYTKSLIISLILSVGVLTTFYIIMQYFQDKWLILAGVAFSLFILLSSYLYPILIDPLFHNFTTLEDESFRSEIVSMAKNAGLEIDEVLIADASRRTSKANAYFTGLGSSKRIVIFDTLLEGFEREEVMTVIAHEMGHWRHSHIVKGIVISIFGAFLSLYILKYLLQVMGVGVGLQSIFIAVLLFAFISLVSMPVQNVLSRSFERQADRAAITLTDDPESFISLKQRLAYSNLGSVNPHPFIKSVMYSHPSTMERIKAAELMR